MSKIIYSFIFIIAITTTSFAKKTFYPGFITTSIGEKVEGKIGVVSLTYNEIRVKFVNEDGKKQTFNPKELRGYSFQVPVFDKKTKKYTVSWVKYESKETEDAVVDFGSKQVFVEKRVEGAIEIFSFYKEDASSVGQGIQHFFYAERRGQLAFTKLTKKNYKEVMGKLTADMPELSKLVGTPGYGYKYIAKIAHTYNVTLGQRQGENADFQAEHYISAF